MRRKKTRRDCVADAEKLRYPSLPLVNVQTLRIGEADPDPYSSDEETEYISLDRSIEMGVLAARTDRSKPIEGPSKEPVKRILRRRIEKEKEYATPKNVRFGEWDPVRDNPTPSPPVSTPSPAPVAMPDAEAATIRKSMERKKHPRVVNVLRVCSGYDYYQAHFGLGSEPYSRRVVGLGPSC